MSDGEGEEEGEMTKAKRIDAALRAAGEMAVSIDMLTRATARVDAEAAGDALTRLLKARYAYDRAIIALTRAELTKDAIPRASG